MLAGFFILGSIASLRPAAMRSGLPAHRFAREQIRGLGAYLSSGYFPEEGQRMPAWLEVLLNVIAFAGFIGIAKYHKAPDGKLPDR
jgi:hypothetical protein